MNLYKAILAHALMMRQQNGVSPCSLHDDTTSSMYDESDQEPVARCFAFTSQELLMEHLPDSCDTEALALTLDEGFDVWLPESIVRSNKDLVEFHHIDNVCKHCAQSMTLCECCDYNRLETSPLLTHIPIALKKLWFSGELAIVREHENGLFDILNVRDKAANVFFPPHNVGLGFDHYIRDYHLR